MYSTPMPRRIPEQLSASPAVLVELRSAWCRATGNGRARPTAGRSPIPLTTRRRGRIGAIELGRCVTDPPRGVTPPRRAFPDAPAPTRNGLTHRALQLRALRERITRLLAAVPERRAREREMIATLLHEPAREPQIDQLGARIDAGAISNLVLVVGDDVNLDDPTLTG